MKKLLTLWSLVFVLGCGNHALAQLCNVKVVTDASPDYYDMESMIHSIAGKWPTPKEKCWAMFYWNHIARRQTSPMYLHGTALTDPIRQFNDYGYAMCSTIAGINCSIWDAMGLKVKYWDIAMHTVSEVFYNGRWHMYDNSMSALYTLCDGKTIAGVQDIGQKGGCEASVGKVEPGHIAKYHCLYATSKNGFLTGADCARSLEHEYHCFNPNALKFRYYYNDWDRGHRYILNLREDEVYTRHYQRTDVNTPHGVQQHPKRPKYLADPGYYVANKGGKDPEVVNTRYRIRGNGRWSWKPKLTASEYRKVVVSAKNIVPFDLAGLRPDTARKTAEVVFKVQGANVITSQVVKLGVFCKSEDDALKLSVSTSNGLVWQEAWDAKETGSSAVSVRLVEQVNGAYEVLLRVSMRAAENPDDVALKSFEVETRTMLNSKTQPQLKLGRNIVYVGLGDQSDSIVLWPDLQADKWKPYAVEHENIVSREQHPGYMGVMHAVKANQEAHVVFKVDAPRDITKVTYGGRLYNRAPRSHIDFLHSFDGGKTWRKSYSLTDTKPPWDVMHYETVERVPAGTRSVLLKYLLNSSGVGSNVCSIFSVRMEVNHQLADRAFKPIEVTFNWSERQEDYSLVERSHTQLVETTPFRYTIDVGGADHPVVNWLRVNLAGAVPNVRYGYSDGKDIPDAEKFVGQRVTYGKNLAEGKSYTLSHPSIKNWGAGDPDGKKLTDGVVGPPYAGGNSYRWGACWNSRTNPVITLDLGEPMACASFGMDFHGYPWWDALKGQVKDKVEVLTSLDGEAYNSQGHLKTDLRWKDLPANHMWPDDEKITGHTFRLIPEEPVTTRYVQYKVTNPRIFDCTELEVLDSVKFEPFDLRIALPDERAAGKPEAVPPNVRSISPEQAARDGARPLGEPVLEPPTLHSLGAYWIIGGDANKDATVAVAYRQDGAEDWCEGPPLFRVGRDAHKDGKGRSEVAVPKDAWLFAGSVVLLEPDTKYELKLTLADPDAGKTEGLLKARTIAEPAAPPNAMEFHVVPGNGGGTGTEQDPCRGLSAAQAKAKPGHVFLLHEGVYEGTFLVTKSGQPGQPIIWRGAGDGEAAIDGLGKQRNGRGISANDAHDVWFENLTIRNARYGFVGHNAYRLVIRRCHIHGVDYGITNTNNTTGRVREWFISDSVIEGPSTWPRTKEIENARGIQMTGTGHVACYNRIRGFADAIDTFPSARCSAIDFHNNEISEMTDDGIEMDYSFRNTRCFHNRLTNVYQGISVQPVYGGPVYIFRNVIYNIGERGSPFKMHNNPSGALMLHNTSVKKGMPMVCYSGATVRNCVYRNNLFIGTRSNYAFESTSRMIDCDFDYDGFGGGPWKKFSKWNGVRYGSLSDMKQQAPVYQNAVLVDPATLFANEIRQPDDEKKAFDSSTIDLRLRDGNAAIDAGQVLPGFNDGFEGEGPDLGAHELGSDLPHYGPRGAVTPQQAAEDKKPKPPAGPKGIPELKVNQLKRPPTIDGVLDDDVWKAASVGTDFRGENGEIPEGKARVLVGQDRENLYVALECFGDRATLKSLTANITAHDSSDIWMDDEMEIFVDPSGTRKSYYQIIVNSAGVTWDAYHGTPGSPDLSWEPKHRHRVGIGKGSWVIELALPLSSFGRTEDFEPNWAFNVLVNRRQAGEVMYWSPVLSSTAHTPGKFGRLVGVNQPKRVSKGWRGNGTGHYPRAGPPLAWAKDKNVVWRTDVGEGFSSPAPVRDRVFVTAEPHSLLCLARDSGKILWKKTNGPDDLPAEFRGRDLEPPTECGYASPTPCSDGKHVYTLFGNGVVACYGLDGNRKWITFIGIEQTEPHGRSASPVLVGDRLIVHVTDLFCLDAGTGKTVWQKPADTAFGTPLPLSIGSVDVVITAMGDTFRLSDGKKLASSIAQVEVASPVAHDGVVYFIGSVATALRLPQSLEGDKLPAPSKLWQVELPGEVYASPVIRDGRIYTVGKDGHFFALDAKTGKTVFAKKLDVDSECAPSLCLAGDHVFLQTDAGVTFVLQPGNEYRAIGKNALPQGSVSTPAFSAGRTLIRDEGALWCIGETDSPTSPVADKNVAGQPPRLPSQATQAERLTRQVPFTGWRGNTTGLYPDATPVVEWGRKSLGIVRGLRISARKPTDDGPGDANPVRNHYPKQWLVIGPFPAPKGLDEPALPDEATVQPDEGGKVGELIWTELTIPDDIPPPYDRGSVAGATNLKFVAPEKVLGGFKADHLVYAHTWLHSESAGAAELIIDHAAGLRVWLNGQEVYRDPRLRVTMNWYTVLSKFRTLQYAVGKAPRVPLKLQKGWNRLLLKLCPPRHNWGTYKFNARIVDPPDAPAEAKNILWAAPLPDRSNATPLIVGDRVIVMAEPEQILCLDKGTGEQLWTRFLGRYQAIPQAERNANPAFKDKVAPLIAKLPATSGLKERLDLRRAIDAALVAIDEKYKLDWDGHMASHFRIVGWTMPTPGTDGKYLYVYCGNGVAACYDFDGNTRWIRHANAGKIYYSSTPALASGKFVLFAGGMNMVALEAGTGTVAWQQPAVSSNVAALVAARINGVDVILSQKGDVVRASDGKLLYADRRKGAGDTGWAPPVCLENVVYQPFSGVGTLQVKDFNGAKGDTWTCQRRGLGGLANARNRDGKWVDKWTCGSPLVHEGIYYNHDVFGTLYAADIRTRKLLYRVDLSHDFNSISHYNAVGVAASVTLGGRYLFAMDNQGTTVVFEPGPVFRKVAVNRIEQQIDRPWAIRPQEEIGYSPPVFEGSRMYLRGEHYLYCIGEE